MFRLKDRDPGQPLPDDLDKKTFGFYIIDARDNSEDYNFFLDLIANPCNYNGKIVYITQIGPTQHPDPFLFAQKFYFNENCEWFESPFVMSGLI